MDDTTPQQGSILSPDTLRSLRPKEQPQAPLAQPWKDVYSVQQIVKVMECHKGDGDIRLQKERDQHVTLGG